MATKFDSWLEENIKKTDEKIVGTPRERLDRLHHFIEFQTTAFHPHINLLSEVQPDTTFLTRDKVEKIIAEAKTFGLRFLVHYRDVNGGPEHIEQFACTTKQHFARCAAQYIENHNNRFDEGSSLVTIATIDLAKISPAKLNDWVDSFYLTVPARFDYSLRLPIGLCYGLSDRLQRKIEEAKTFDVVAC
jgi:hypothetical protein